jgi:hypothetical protein
MSPAFVRMHDVRVTNQDLEKIIKITSISQFLVFQSNVQCDLGLLRDSRELKYLHVEGCNLSTMDLGFLAHEEQLEVLYLGGANISDRMLPDLSRLTELRELSLVDNPITSRGVRRLHLDKLQLDELNLGGTMVDDDVFFMCGRPKWLRLLATPNVSPIRAQLFRDGVKGKVDWSPSLEASPPREYFKSLREKRN